MTLNGNIRDDGSVIFPVEIITPLGESKTVDGLFDTGGGRSLISASLADSLNLEIKMYLRIVGSNTAQDQPTYFIFIKIENIINDEKLVPVTRCETFFGNLIVIGRPLLKEWDVDYRGQLKTFEIRIP